MVGGSQKLAQHLKITQLNILPNNNNNSNLTLLIAIETDNLFSSKRPLALGYFLRDILLLASSVIASDPH